MDKMVSAICRELVLQRDYLGNETIDTIYFGGGTPSLLDQRSIEGLLAEILKNHNVSAQPEITLEANPDDLNFSKLKELAEVGINRLSIGIQSFNDQHLHYLNRAHNSQEAKTCVERSREAGIDNVSIDLIYGIPSTSHDIWYEDLNQAISLNPTHISSYCLTIEEKTAFGNWLKKGKIKSINDEYAARQFEILVDTLGANGYEQYEISNFAKPGLHSRHNSSYWKQKKYLGVGPSAHSYDGINRQFNISHNKKYIDSVDKDQAPFTLDELNHNDHVNEYILTTLRTKWGTDLNYLKSKYQLDLEVRQDKYITNLISLNHAVVKDDHLILTDQGKLFADKIASDLFLV